MAKLRKVLVGAQIAFSGHNLLNQVHGLPLVQLNQASNQASDPSGTETVTRVSESSASTASDSQELSPTCRKDVKGNHKSCGGGGLGGPPPRKREKAVSESAQRRLEVKPAEPPSHRMYTIDPTPLSLSDKLSHFAGQFGWRNRGELCLSYKQQARSPDDQLWRCVEDRDKVSGESRCFYLKGDSEEKEVDELKPVPSALIQEQREKVLGELLLDQNEEEKQEIMFIYETPFHYQWFYLDADTNFQDDKHLGGLGDCRTTKSLEELYNRDIALGLPDDTYSSGYTTFVPREAQEKWVALKQVKGLWQANLGLGGGDMVKAAETFVHDVEKNEIEKAEKAAIEKAEAEKAAAEAAKLEFEQTEAAAVEALRFVDTDEVETELQELESLSEQLEVDTEEVETLESEAQEDIPEDSEDDDEERRLDEDDKKERRLLSDDSVNERKLSDDKKIGDKKTDKKTKKIKQLTDKLEVTVENLKTLKDRKEKAAQLVERQEKQGNDDDDDSDDDDGLDDDDDDNNSNNSSQENLARLAEIELALNDAEGKTMQTWRYLMGTVFKKERREKLFSKDKLDENETKELDESSAKAMAMLNKLPGFDAEEFRKSGKIKEKEASEMKTAIYPPLCPNFEDYNPRAKVMERKKKKQAYLKRMKELKESPKRVLSEKTEEEEEEEKKFEEFENSFENEKKCAYDCYKKEEDRECNRENQKCAYKDVTKLKFGDDEKKNPEITTVEMCRYIFPHIKCNPDDKSQPCQKLQRSQCITCVTDQTARSAKECGLLTVWKGACGLQVYFCLLLQFVVL